MTGERAPIDWYQLDPAHAPAHWLYVFGAGLIPTTKGTEGAARVGVILRALTEGRYERLLYIAEAANFNLPTSAPFLYYLERIWLRPAEPTDGDMWIGLDGAGYP